MRRTFLFGNGLSLAFNADYYQLPALTLRVRERLSRMEQPDGSSLLDYLEDIADALRPDLLPGRRETFEDIAGPIDRLANTLSEFGPLVRVATNEQRATLRDLQSTLRVLYKRVVGAVLEQVMEHPATERGWGPVLEVGSFLVREAMEQEELDVFCLNYDALLDAALLEARTGEFGGRFALSDEFQGYGDEEIPVVTAHSGLIGVRALPWRWGRYSGPRRASLRLHHLHGAGTWMRYREGVWKARNLGAIRDAGLFAAWAEGIEGDEVPGQVEPVVILGDQKGTSIERTPFTHTYEAFASAVSRSEEIVLAGYSFMDEPLNGTISSYRQPGSRVVVVNPSEDIEAIARQQLGLRADDPLVVVHERLPGGLLALPR